MIEQLKKVLLGKARNPRDPRLFHQLSLAAFLAWVGLGADGLSSCAYGPDEAFRALLGHPHLAVALAVATAVTVFVISLAYSRLIEYFPNGGGGYVVSAKLLGPYAGVLAGCALIVDYVLTITVSVVSAADQIFSFIPVEYHAHWKLPTVFVVIAVLIALNLRGVKESIMVIMPIFLFFIVTHVIALIGCLWSYADHIPLVARQTYEGMRYDVSHIGLWATFLIFLNAYARGAGTYTGIEAVANAVPIMREPKAQTAKTTMLYMAVSLAVTAGGILLAYLLTGAEPIEGKTMNASFLEKLGYGHWFVVATLVAECGLLLIAAQTGFIGGPSVMANMALDHWLPRRFASLSEQFSMAQGVILMGIAALASLMYAHGNISTLVTMYAINVFLTFALSQMGMCRMWWQRRSGKGWLRKIWIHAVALVLCLGILIGIVAEKFLQGAWVTLAITGSFVLLCFWFKSHYSKVQRKLDKLTTELVDLPLGSAHAVEPKRLERNKPTAVIMVSGYSGIGIHSLLAIIKQFPGHFKQVIFASVAVLESGVFKGVEEVSRLEESTIESLKKYTRLANQMGLQADWRIEIGTDPVELAEQIAIKIAQEFPKSVIFGGKLVFARDTLLTRLLHNETAAAIQRRLQWRGIPMVILPVCVRD